MEFTYFFDCYALEDGLFTTSVEYGDMINLNLQLPEDVTGNANVKIGDNGYEVSLLKGKGNVSIPTVGLNMGNNTIYAAYPGDSKYTSKTINETIFIYDESNKPAGKITSKDFKLKINEVVNLNNGDTTAFSFTCPKNAEGKIAVWINEIYNPDICHDYYIDGNYLGGETTNITLSILGIKYSGKYDLVIRYFPYSGRNLTIASGSVNVIKSSAADINADEFNVQLMESVELGKDYAFSFNCPYGAQGKIAILIDGNYVEDEFHDYYVDGEYINGETTLIFLQTIGITDAGEYDITVKYVPYFGDNLTIGSGKIIVSKQLFDAEFYNSEEFNYKSEWVLTINEYPSTGNLTIYVDNNLQYLKIIENPSQFVFVKLNELNIAENGEYNISVKFKNDEEEYEVGNFTITVDVDWSEEIDDNIELFSYLDILNHEDDIALISDSEGLVGNVSIYIDDELYFAKEFQLSDNLKDLFITADDLKVFNNISLGNHTVKVIYMKNGVEQHVASKKVNFEATCDIEYDEEMPLGEKTDIIVTAAKQANGNVTVYYGVKSENNEWVRGNEIVVAVDFVEGVAKISLDSLNSGKYKLYLNISTDIYQDEIALNVNIRQNTPGLTASVTNEIALGETVFVIFNGPKSDKKVFIYLDGNEYAAISLEDGMIKEGISKLSVGLHSIKISFRDGDNLYVNNFTVTVKQKDAADVNVPKKTNVVKLTLKKVKVRKYAKKLVIKATLKINGKAAKNKKVTFKFNGKKYVVKTNKKGIAKLTVKQKVLKKLKIGKKIKYQVSYGKKVVKRTVKVKR